MPLKSCQIKDLIVFSGRYILLPLINSYKFISINSNTNARVPVDFSLRNQKKKKEYTHKISSTSLIIWGCGDSLLSACTSLKLLACSKLSNFAFIFFIATNLKSGKNDLNTKKKLVRFCLCFENFRERSFSFLC